MEEFNKAREYLIEKGVESPVVGIVLGSGLNNLMKHVDVKLTIPYADIPGFPISTVEFHKGNEALRHSKAFLIKCCRRH